MKVFFRGMLEVAIEAAIAGGKVLSSYYKEHCEQGLTFGQNHLGDLFSKADTETQKIINRIILKSCPDAEIVGEEISRKGNGSKWYVDPLDGTNNFKNKIPDFCISIGVEMDGQMIAGVIYHPILNDIYRAELNKGAYLNRNRIQVNSLDLQNGFVGMLSYIQGIRAKHKIQMIKELAKVTRFINTRGSTALELARVASGSLVGYVADNFKSWDIAAGVLLVKEAGGIISDQYGQPLAPDSCVLVAGNKNHSKLVDITKVAYDGYAGG